MKVKTIKLLGFIIKSVMMGIIAALFLFVFFPHLIQPDVGHKQTPRKIEAPLSFAEAIKITSPSVVNIRTIVPDIQRRRDQLTALLGMGSGVIISHDGYVVTNYHVINKAEAIAVQLIGGRQAIAKVIGVDPDTDLAVLKIPTENIIPLKMDSSVEVNVGDITLVIGNPFGAGQTVTMGIVSAKGRRFVGLSQYENFIQTDAAVNPGNSGGALINTNGDFLGISSAYFTRGTKTGISYAIPMALVMDIAQEIISNGRVVRGWLGFVGSPLSRIGKEKFGTDCCQISEVTPNGPADLSGLKENDIIIKVNNKLIGADELQMLITNATPGTEIIFEIIRGQETINLTTVIKEKPHSVQNS